MSQWEKLLARIHNNPKTVTFDELDKILRRAGYVRRQLRSGSSQHVKESYVKEALRVLDEEGTES